MSKMTVTPSRQKQTFKRPAYGWLNWHVTTAWMPGDEAGEKQFFALPDLKLENGQTLPQAVLAYQTWGKLSKQRDNAVLICHALTGDAHVTGEAGPGQPTAGWWAKNVGPGLTIDTNRFFVVCANVLGGCQGSTGPAWPAPDGLPWGSRFPWLTTADQVQAEAQLADHLGIYTWSLVVGASAGGFRALEWAVGYPDRVKELIVLATSAETTADQTTWAHTQLRALELDPHFADGDYYLQPIECAPTAGLALARQIAHATYRSAEELQTRFRRYPQHQEDPLTGGRYAVQSYFDYHGDKLVNRFDAGSYRVLTRALLTHSIGRDRGGVAQALCQITARTLVVGVDSDRLFPARECQKLAEQIPGAQYQEISSPAGHDGFLIEADQVDQIIRDFLQLV